MSTESIDVNLESSTGEEIKDAAVETAQVETGEAESSAAQGAEERDLLDVVRDVVDQSDKPSTDSPSTEQEVTAEKAGDEDPNKPEADKEDFSDVPFNKHPRFRELLEQRNKFKPAAEQHFALQGFLQETGLSDKEAADGLIIMATAKTNPSEAWRQIKPWVQNLLVAAGEIVPEQLQQRVDAGELPYDAALELSKAQARAQSVEAAQAFRQQQEQQRQQQERASACQNAATAWETHRRQTDLDFEKKLPALQREVVYLQRIEGVPDTPEGVKGQIEKAYRTVNTTFRPVAPQPKPAKTPVMGGQATAAAKAQPNSVLDVIDATLERMHAG